MPTKVSQIKLRESRPLLYLPMIFLSLLILPMRKMSAMLQHAGPIHPAVRLPNQYEAENKKVVQTDVAQIEVSMKTESGERKNPLAV